MGQGSVLGFVHDHGVGIYGAIRFGEQDPDRIRARAPQRPPAWVSWPTLPTDQKKAELCELIVALQQNDHLLLYGSAVRLDRKGDGETAEVAFVLTEVGWQRYPRGIRLTLAIPEQRDRIGKLIPPQRCGNNEGRPSRYRLPYLLLANKIEALVAQGMSFRHEPVPFTTPITTT